MGKSKAKHGIIRYILPLQPAMAIVAAASVSVESIIESGEQNSSKGSRIRQVIRILILATKVCCDSFALDRLCKAHRGGICA